MVKNHKPRRLPKRKLYQDEIYGSCELSPLAIILMDTPEFQRLAGIFQLGMAHTLFRGAGHRRFEHSVGTYFVLRELMDRIEENHARLFHTDPEAYCHPGMWVSRSFHMPAEGADSPSNPMTCWQGLREALSAAALLHDLGHIPQGHTLEDEFSIFNKHDSLGNARLFELLYGPRECLDQTNDKPKVLVERYFSPIDRAGLPEPKTWDLRVPLPWVFEEGLFEPVFENLNNPELRDFIYLVLSYEETITETKIITFETKLKEALEGSEDSASKKARIRFLQHLYEKWRHLFGFQPFMPDLVCSTICADLLDYLKRDGRRLNLDIRTNPRLQRYMVIRPDKNQSLRLIINGVYRNGLPRRDTVSDLLDLMGERYRCAEVVYFHPKKCAFSAMFAKALELCPAPPRDGDGIYPAPWTSISTTPHVTHFGDESLLAYLSGSSERVKRLAARITYRDEYRLLFTLDYEAAQHCGGADKIISGLRNNRDQGRLQLEAEVEEMIKEDPCDGPGLLIYCPNLKMQAKEVATWVELIPDQVKPLNQQKESKVLSDEIRILNNKHQALWRLYLYVNPMLWAQNIPLKAIIDLFCDRFNIQEKWRKRGARIPY